MNASFLFRSSLRAALAATILFAASAATAQVPDGVVGGPGEPLMASDFNLAPGAGMVVGPSPMGPMVGPMGPMVGPMGPMGPMVGPVGPAMPQPYRLGFRGADVGWGVEIVSIARGGVAAEIGLEPGDVIVELNGQRVQSVADYHAIMARSGGLVQLVVRDVRTGRLAQLPAFTLNEPASVACAVAGP